MANKFQPFNVNNDDWTLYQEQLTQFFAANDIKDDSLKVANLLSNIGVDSYKLVRNLCLPKLPATKTFDELCELLKLHCCPRVNIWRERRKFDKSEQLPSETISQWGVRLQSLSENCAYGADLNKMMMNKFMSGMRPSSVYDRLCEEKVDKSTFETLKEIAVQRENLQENGYGNGAKDGVGGTEDVLYHRSTSSTKNYGQGRNTSRNRFGDARNQESRNFSSKRRLNNRQRSPSGTRQGSTSHSNGSDSDMRQQKKAPCKVCGSFHPQPCKYKNYTCARCHSIGHLARVCKKKQVNFVSEGPRSVPFAYKQQLDQQIEAMVQEGILTPIETSQWGTPLVPIIKSDGTLRICAAYSSTINKYLAEEVYALPRIDELFAKLANGQHFTKLDLCQAYNQFELDDEAKKLLVWSTHRGLMRMNRLPFGVAPASGKFQRYIEQILQGVKNCVVFLDEILLIGIDRVSHLKTLEEVLLKLQDAGLTLKLNKCQFFKKSVTYLGHSISKHGPTKTDDKIKAILEAKIPQNITENRAVLGLITFYAKFKIKLTTKQKFPNFDTVSGSSKIGYIPKSANSVFSPDSRFSSNSENFDNSLSASNKNLSVQQNQECMDRLFPHEMSVSSSVNMSNCSSSVSSDVENDKISIDSELSASICPLSSQFNEFNLSQESRMCEENIKINQDIRQSKNFIDSVNKPFKNIVLSRKNDSSSSSTSKIVGGSRNVSSLGVERKISRAKKVDDSDTGPHRPSRTRKTPGSLRDFVSRMSFQTWAKGMWYMTRQQCGETKRRRRGRKRKLMVPLRSTLLLDGRPV